MRKCQTHRLYLYIRHAHLVCGAKRTQRGDVVEMIEQAQVEVQNIHPGSSFRPIRVVEVMGGSLSPKRSDAGTTLGHKA